MIPITYKKNTKFLVFGVCGTIMALIGCLLYTFDPIEALIQSMATLSPSSILFKLWKKPPLEVFIKVRIFNITNHEKFLSGVEKMNVEEIGPYIYQEEIFNENPHFNENGTITFEPKRKLTFRPELSAGSLSDIVMSPNIPLLGISSYLRDASFFVNLAVAQIANMLDSQAFLNLTVEEYLWGYDDRLVTLANKAIPSWINFERFGIVDRLMALDNGTNVVTIKGDIPSDDMNDQPYSIQQYNGQTGLDQWGHSTNPKCGNLKGNFVEGLFPKNLNPNVTVGLYRRAFCRPVPFIFEKHGELSGYETLDYRIDQLFMGTKEERPENECFCIKGKCPKKGVNNISPCYYGIPITLTQPHFYNCDPLLKDMVTGMKPEKDSHDSVLRIEKNLGLPIGANLRIQINLDVDTKFSSRCRPFNGLTLPLFWLELNVNDIPYSIDVLMMIYYHVLPVGKYVLIWGLMLFGVAMVAASALFTFFGPTDYGLEDPFSGRVGYSPIKIIPMNPPTIRISK